MQIYEIFSIYRIIIKPLNMNLTFAHTANQFDNKIENIYQ